MPEEITVREAGHRGGTKVKERYGPEFFKRIGQMGGRTTAERHGTEFYKEIGRKGGLKGGARVRELIARAKAEELKERGG